MKESEMSIIYNNENMPYSPDAEQAVLGAILLDKSCLSQVVEILPRADYFYLTPNKIIYQAMIDLFTLGKSADFVTISDEIEKNPDYNKSTDKNYLLQVAQTVPSISNVEAYCKIVRDKYDKRMLINAAHSMLDEAADSSIPAQTLLDSAEQKIFDIRTGKNIQGLQKLNEIIMQTLDRLDALNSENSDEFKAISTGLSGVDQVTTGLNKSDLILLAARPGMGKTSFALNIASNVSMKSHKKVAFFSLEMTKEQLASRILSTEARVEGTKLRTGELNEDEWTRIIEASDIISNANMYIDDTPRITIPEMKAKLRRLQDVDLVFIDYLQLMGSARRIENRVQEISEITRSLKIMAKEINVPVVVLSQLSRASEQRTEHRPMLSDLRDSGSIEQDADMVLFLYRPFYYSQEENSVDEDQDKNAAECIVAKNRHGDTRAVNLHWQGEFMRFTSPEVIHSEEY